LSGLAPLLCARSSSTMIRSCDRCCRSVEQTKLWQRWIEKPGLREAYELSLISAVVTFIAFLLGVVLAAVTSSAATLGYGLENFVDFCSSLVVIWRFYGNAPPEVLHSREKRASVGIGIMMVILAVVVLGVAVDHVVQANELEGVDILLALAVPSFFIFGILAYMKFYLAQHLRSPALKKDAVCSSAGVVLSGGVLVGAAIFRHHEEVWWFDAAVAIVISTGLLIYGGRTMVKNAVEGNRYWTLGWWQDDGRKVRRRPDR